MCTSGAAWLGSTEALKLAGDDEGTAARRPHQQLRNHRDRRDAEDDRERARAGTGRHDGGLSVRSGDD